MGTSLFIMVDVEATGPCPGLYSMTELGAVVVEEPLARTFYAKLRPIEGTALDKEAVRVMGYDPAAFADWPEPEGEIRRFGEWLDGLGKRPMFVSDNPGFDFQFVNYYFWKFYGRNPFGHSSTNLGSLYKGAARDMYQSFKHLRVTPHTHNPVDDAMGNAEALITMAKNFGIQGILPKQPKNV